MSIILALRDSAQRLDNRVLRQEMAQSKSDIIVLRRLSVWSGYKSEHRNWEKPSDPPSACWILSSNLTFELPDMTAYPAASSGAALLMVSVCLLPSDDIIYLSPPVMSLVSRCHLTLASSFSVCASNITVAPTSAVWFFGFLAKADTEKDKDDEDEHCTKVHFCLHGL